jgi:hypothetical protein
VRQGVVTRQRLLLLPVIFGLAGVLAFAGPASAATSGGTPVIVEVGGTQCLVRDPVRTVPPPP